MVAVDVLAAGDEEKIKGAGKSIGGSALNAAFALQWQDVNRVFGGYVGRDETGGFIVGELKKIGGNKLPKGGG
ncbi:MAG: carbohydrate kinase family protein [Firmicutes bacterium]|nr:carbohydrate kinase family protein [Bacillota bacterium]